MRLCLKEYITDTVAREALVLRVGIARRLDLHQASVK